LVSHIKGGILTEGFREHGAEENICIEEGSVRRVEKTA
jgi:hypothetical protein